MQRAELYSWEIYEHPEGQRVRGIIKNDSSKRFVDGRRIFTSLIKKIETNYIETLNTVYELKGTWEGPWTHRTLENEIKEEEGPVHFEIVRG